MVSPSFHLLFTVFFCVEFNYIGKTDGCTNFYNCSPTFHLLLLLWHVSMQNCWFHKLFIYFSPTFHLLSIHTLPSFHGKYLKLLASPTFHLLLTYFSLTSCLHGKILKIAGFTYFSPTFHLLPDLNLTN